MISSETPDKLADIIRDTWPNLYRPNKDYVPPALYKSSKMSYSDKNISKNEQI
jgi:hypothetical protein